MALTKYAIMARDMFAIDACDRACSSNYTCYARFEQNGGSLLFWLPPKSLANLKNSGFYKFTSCMGTSLFLTALAFHRCEEVNWDKNDVRDGFVFYEIPTVEV